MERRHVERGRRPPAGGDPADVARAASEKQFAKPLLSPVVILCLAVLAGAVHAGSQKVGTTAGKTYGEWSAGWWQWMLSIPAVENPQDAQGDVDCSLNNSGPVWFLAGGEAGKPAQRSCGVPAGKRLFFPVLNLLLYNAEGENMTVADKRSQLGDFFGAGEPGAAASGYDGPRPCDLFATIDGQAVARLAPEARVQSPPFAIDTGDGPFGFAPGLVDREAVSEGYWVMLPPLAPGAHTLRFGSRFCRAGSLSDHPDFGSVDVTYRLDVVGFADKSGGDSDSDSDSELENVEIIESLYAAFSAGDLDTILAIIDEDVVWIESEGIPYGGTFIGRDAVFEGVFGKIGEDWDDFTATVDETFAADGDQVIVRQRDGGTFKATGKSMEAWRRVVFHARRRTGRKFQKSPTPQPGSKIALFCARSTRSSSRQSANSILDGSARKRKVPGPPTGTSICSTA